MPLPDGMPARMLLYRWYAKMYHYDPRAVDALPLEVLTWFPIIEEAEAVAQERLHKMEQRAQRHR